MPEPIQEAGQGTQTEEIASTPAPTQGQDKQPTTTTQSEEQKPPGESLMDFLDIPKDVQSQIALPKEVPSPAESDSKPTEVQKQEQEQKQEHEEEDEEEDEEETPQPDTAAQAQKPDKRQKRINRLTRKLHSTEAQLDSALQNLQKAQAILQEKQGSAEQPLTIGTGPLAYVTNEAQLNQEIEKAEAIIEFCDANPNGVTTGEGDRERFIDPDEIAQWKRRSERVTRNAPNRRDEIRSFNAQKQYYDGLAQQIWPELFDRSSEEYQVAQALLKKFSSVKNTPEAAYAVGLVVEGARSLERKSAGNGAKPKVRRDISERVFEPRVPLAPTVPEPPTREGKPSSQKRLNEAMSRLVNDPDGGVENLANVFAAREAADNTRHARSPVKS